MHPAPPSEHAHAGHPTLRAIAQAVRDGRTTWTVKELQDVFPGISVRLLYALIDSGRLETTAHSSVRDTTRPVHVISTRSVVTYFVETTKGLSQAEVIECMTLAIKSGLTRRALRWLRDAIDRQLAVLGTLPEIALPGEPAAATTLRRASASAADAQPTLFDLNPVVEPQATATPTPSQHAA